MSFRTIAFAAVLLFGTAAKADDIVVFTPNPFVPVFEELQRGFEAKTGVRLILVRDTAGGVAAHVGKGEPFDLAVTSTAGVKQLLADGKLAAGTDRVVGRSMVGVAVPEGAPVPKIDTVEDFKNLLLTTRAVAYTDPASGGSSGIYLSQLWSKLGIAEAVKAKAVLVPGGLAAERLVNGEATVALQQAGELMVVKGARYVGPIPSEIQYYTVYAAAIGSAAKQSAAARGLLDDLMGPAATNVMQQHGMDRP